MKVLRNIFGYTLRYREINITIGNECQIQDNREENEDDTGIATSIELTQVEYLE